MTKKYFALIILLLSMFLTYSCEGDSGRGFSPAYPNVLLEDYDALIYGGDMNIYVSITPAVTGWHEIALYNVTTDQSWELEDSGFNLIYDCDDHNFTHDEIAEVYLYSTETYDLYIVNWDGADGYYDLIVTY